MIMIMIFVINFYTENFQATTSVRMHQNFYASWI